MENEVRQERGTVVDIVCITLILQVFGFTLILQVFIRLNRLQARIGRTLPASRSTGSLPSPLSRALAIPTPTTSADHRSSTNHSGDLRSVSLEPDIEPINHRYLLLSLSRRRTAVIHSTSRSHQKKASTTVVRRDPKSVFSSFDFDLLAPYWLASSRVLGVSPDLLVCWLEFLACLSDLLVFVRSVRFRN
ncbi:hypothetical protein L2E82_30670 [Cichorium intybus]|uniref:Uncharacterized protein n=1 Tax=Cichorium intybus TaxID=13427 RepID=A0ACB9D168_CICIN|nr:hypothetical protein L2E82_30670 [Cichorium intybus]